jgi:REG-2-like HAD superfamily hydrolase
MSKLRLVTFDVVGTLASLRGGVGRFYAREARRHGVELRGAMPFSPEQLLFRNPYNKPQPAPKHVSDEIDASFHKAFKEISKKWPNFGFNHKINTQDWWREVVFLTFREADYLKLKEEEEKLELIAQRLFEQFSGVEGYKLYPETRLVLTDLRERVDKFGIVTNTDERIHSVLNSLGISNFFDFVICSKEFGVEKPSKQIFEEALKIAKVDGKHQFVDQLLKLISISI